ncbi:MAG TPA: hypothetical protein VNM90_25310 [Haliangium sp.]|nr:hypothetical protein [Haliangium sp.]
MQIVIRAPAGGDLRAQMVIRALAEGDLRAQMVIRALAEGDLRVQMVIRALAEGDLRAQMVVRALAKVFCVAQVASGGSPDGFLPRSGGREVTAVMVGSRETGAKVSRARTAERAIVRRLAPGCIQVETGTSSSLYILRAERAWRSLALQFWAPGL